MIWKYLKYVLRHKWYVMLAGFKYRVWWYQLFLHDWTKFLPSEFLPYTRYFYGKYPKFSEVHGDGRYLYRGKYKEEVKTEFDLAWNLHQKRNPHHWQYWVLIKDTGETIPLLMPERFVREMLADWTGAGRAINGKDDTVTWYKKNRDNMILHPETRDLVNTLLGLPTSSPLSYNVEMR